MSAYKDALRVSSAEQGPRLKLAAELLAGGSSVVLVDGTLALRPHSDGIICEVISCGAIAPEIQAQRAKQRLEASTLRSALDTEKCQWLVVEDYGTGTVELWRES